MLRHGLQELQGSALVVVPSRKDQRSDAEALAERYQTFRAAG